MANTQFWEFMSTAMQMAVIIPTVLVIIPRWRFSPWGMRARALGLEVLVAAAIWLVYLFFGTSDLAIWLAGFLAPAICTIAFWYCCQLRDGRFLFLMVTLALYSLLCDSLSNIFFPRGTPGWVVVRVAVGLLQLLLLYLFCRRRLLEMLNGNQINWTVVSLIPLSLWACLMAFYMPVVLAKGRTPALFTVMFTAAVVLIYVTLYRFQQATLEEAESRKYGALLRSEVHYLEREAHHAQTVEQNARILRHDLRHYVGLIRSCLEGGDVESARQVADRLEEKTGGLANEGGLRAFTGRPILDMVLTQAEERARDLGARFQVRLDLPQALAMEEVELAVVFSNALENALNALGEEPLGAPRQVSVTGRPLGSQFLLEFANSFSGQLEMDKRTGLPRAYQEGHGYGTRSIASFVEKYRGTLDCAVRDGMFLLRLLF